MSSKVKWAISGLCVVVGLIIWLFAPLFECDWCRGIGSITVEEANEVLDLHLTSKPPPNTFYWSCERYAGTKRISGATKLISPVPKSVDEFRVDSIFPKIRQLRQLRGSGP